MKSWIEISASRLRANYAAIGHAAGPEHEPLCVLKANAYGHGATLCAPVLVAAGARWLGVADLEEGIAVRRALAEAGLANRNTRILIMCGFEPGDAPGLLEHHLTPVVWTPEHLQALAAIAHTYTPVHIELDTGMSRQGVRPGADLSRLVEQLRATPFLQWEGLFSHLSSSEIADSPVTAAQQHRFAQALAQTEHLKPPSITLPSLDLDPDLRASLQADLQSIFDTGRPIFVHLGNSSAIDEASTLPWLPNAAPQIGMRYLVRPGLALYGYTLPLAGGATPHLSPQLQPVGTWKTRILALRDLQPGDTVGYGATFTATQPLRTALLPVGYADGLRREASSGLGNGWVMIAGQQAPILGRVSMNLTVVDVTQHTRPPLPGDEAILLGPGVIAHDHARWANTIPYEILCGLRAHHRLTP